MSNTGDRRIRENIAESWIADVATQRYQLKHDIWGRYSICLCAEVFALDVDSAWCIIMLIAVS